MTRRRWIADEWTGDRAALTGAHAAHLARVLRARVGQQFDVAACQRVRRGRVLSVSPERVEFELGEDLETAADLQLTILLAIFRFERYEWAVEKLTELGVAKIIPVIGDRTGAHLARAAAKRAERWRRIARAAAEQSRRAAPPEIADPVPLAEALSMSSETCIVLSESEKAMALTDLLSAQPRGAPLLLAIGPEGGWTKTELDAFAAHGWEPASLGRNILRAETAAIAAVAIAAAQTS